MTKQEKYEELLPQVLGLIEGETNAVSVMARMNTLLSSSAPSN